MTTTDLRRVDNNDDGYGYDDDVDVTPTESMPAVEREVKGELVQGQLADRDVYVPPVKQWRASALHALREGDFETWAKITLEDDDWDAWQAVDPTMEDIEKFFASVNPGLGTDRGNSRASRRSSKTTRKR